jgi:hypothetical protein
MNAIRDPLSKRTLAFVIFAILGSARVAVAQTPPPLDVREPPFGEFDVSWLNGTDRRPGPLLKMGPITASLYLDTYYAWQLSAPADHTILASTVASRHDEFSINQASLGLDLTGLDGPIGRLYIQYGTYTETVGGQDATTARGYFLTNRAFNYIQQAALGWHFHWRYGANLEIGILPAYVGIDSYLTQENWNYTHPFTDDFVPFYFAGIRAQLYATRRLKAELWLVNGWQTFGSWHETKAGALVLQWQPREWLALLTSAYVGQEAVGDPDSVRFYNDNWIQIRYYKSDAPRRIKSAALCIQADAGYERRGNAPSGPMAGLLLAHRIEWSARWATTVRGDIFYDRTQALITPLPAGSPYSLPVGCVPGNCHAFLGGGGTITLDYLPSPWLLIRAEYSHREANIPYFSGHGGTTGPGGVAASASADPLAAKFTPDLSNRDDRLILNATLRL